MNDIIHDTCAAKMSFELTFGKPPAYIYVGHIEWDKIKASMVLIAHTSLKSDVDSFCGLSLIRVNAESHFNVTGECLQYESRPNGIIR